MYAVLAFLIFALFFVPLALYYAWAASWLWLWFIVPVFNAPALGVLQLWGVALALRALRPHALRMHKVKDEEFDWSAFGGSLLAPLIALAIGYVLKFWWMV